jgi:two-component system, cell cycle response regulator DivK
MNRTVLLIEDNEQNRYLVTFLLEKHGYTVVPAATGREALDLVRTLSPAIILLDIQLPEMNGYAIARALRSAPALATIPIIAVTSYAMPGDRESALAAGCDGYVEKPIDPDSFVSEIQRFLPDTR